jgi:BD-FAE
MKSSGKPLNGDLYRARSPDGTLAPALIAVHGGGWKIGSAKEFRYLGPWLAERGITLFSIEYRLVKGETNRYPASAHDVRAAVQFIRANALELGIDPARIGLLGASAGAHLVSLVALAGENSRFLREFPKHPHADISSSVKCVGGFMVRTTSWPSGAMIIRHALMTMSPKLSWARAQSTIGFCILKLPRLRMPLDLHTSRHFYSVGERMTMLSIGRCNLGRL